MKVIFVTLVSLFLVSCGRSGSGTNATWESQKPQKPNPLRQVKLSGLHTGKKWEAKLALMHEAELFDKPALSFDIVTEVLENPCEGSSKSKGVLVTIQKEKKNHEADFDRYINFYDQDTNRYLGSPNFKYQLKMVNGAITSLGILFDIGDKEYGIEGYVNVIDCRSKT